MVQSEFVNVDLTDSKNIDNKIKRPDLPITLDQWMQTCDSGNCLLNNNSTSGLLEFTSDNKRSVLCITARSEAEFERKYDLRQTTSDSFITVVDFSSMDFRVSDLSNECTDEKKEIDRDRLLYSYIKESLSYDHYDYLVIEGMEEYFLNGDFNTLWKELEDIKDLVLENNSKLILLLDKHRFTEQQYALLGRYMDFVDN